MSTDTNRSRQAKGVPVGGQFATEAHAESDVRLVPSGAGHAHAEMAHLLELHGLDTIPDDQTGASFADRWDETFGVLDGPAPPSIDSAIFDQLGKDFDIGRARGGPELVWYDPTVAMDDEDESSGQWASMADNPSGFDDDRLELAVSFYTRNGGGNRDCYCEDSEAHEGGCLGATVDLLTSRPDHLHDQDGSFDSTYATFYFQLDKTPQIRAAIDAREQAGARLGAQRTLEAMLDGKVGPWQVLAPNPTTGQVLADQRILANAATPNADMSAFGSAIYLRAALPDHLADVDAVLAYAANPTGQRPALERSRWNHTSRLDSALDGAVRARDARQKAADLDATLTQIDAGALPAAVTRVLDRERVVRDKGWAEQAAREQTETARRRVATITTARADLADVIQARADRAAAAARVAELEWALHWPGGTESCPPKFVPENH